MRPELNRETKNHDKTMNNNTTIRDIIQLAKIEQLEYENKDQRIIEITMEIDKLQKEKKKLESGFEYQSQWLTEIQNVIHEAINPEST
jgi:hypothetical protein